MTDAVRITAAPHYVRALEHANRVRIARAELKRRVTAGAVSAAEVILSAPWQAQTMPISDLLASQRSWGRIRSRRLLRSLQVSEHKQVGALTERQRVALAASLARGIPAPALRP